MKISVMNGIGGSMVANGLWVYSIYSETLIGIVTCFIGIIMLLIGVLGEIKLKEEVKNGQV